MSGRISISDNLITLGFNNDKQHSHACSALQKFYCLTIDNYLQPDDSTCFLFVFTNEIWLIPENTWGMLNLKPWLQDLSHDQLVFATIENLPFKWRSRWFIIPGFEAKLKVLRPTELNKISDRLSVINDASINDLHFPA